MTTITGNTFPVKEQIKALGGKWNSTARGWDVPDDKADDARRLVEAAPASTPPPRHGGSRGFRRTRYTRFSSGAVVYQNHRGRCEDAPCCGCCS